MVIENIRSFVLFNFKPLTIKSAIGSWAMVLLFLGFSVLNNIATMEAFNVKHNLFLLICFFIYTILAFNILMKNRNTVESYFLYEGISFCMSTIILSTIIIKNSIANKNIYGLFLVLFMVIFFFILAIIISRRSISIMNNIKIKNNINKYAYAGGMAGSVFGMWLARGFANTSQDNAYNILILFLMALSCISAFCCSGYCYKFFLIRKYLGVDFDVCLESKKPKSKSTAVHYKKNKKRP